MHGERTECKRNDGYRGETIEMATGQWLKIQSRCTDCLISFGYSPVSILFWKGLSLLMNTAEEI